MSIQNKVTKTVQDLFMLASDELQANIATAKIQGKLNISDTDVEIVNEIVKQVVSAVFMRGCVQLEKAMK